VVIFLDVQEVRVEKIEKLEMTPFCGRFKFNLVLLTSLGMTH